MDGLDRRQQHFSFLTSRLSSIRLSWLMSIYSPIPIPILYQANKPTHAPHPSHLHLHPSFPSAYLFLHTYIHLSLCSTCLA